MRPAKTWAEVAEVAREEYANAYGVSGVVQSIFRRRVVRYAGVLSVACLAGWGVWQISQARKDEERLNEVLNDEVDALATDFVEDEILEVEEASGAPSRAVVVYNNGIAVARVVDAINSPDEKPSATSRGVASLKTDLVDVELHRRVPRRKRTPYIASVVAECRMTFGCAVRSDANIRAIRRCAVKIMKSHGVRPAHINAIIPEVVEMVFVPTDADIAAKAMSRSWATWYREWRYNGTTLPSLDVATALTAAKWFGLTTPHVRG
jgi:hypothetical protein